MTRLPKTKSDALATGAKFFATGRPCKRGHVSKRYVSGSCFACKAEDRIRNSEAARIYAIEWRKRNPEKTSEYHIKQRESGYGVAYYQKNRKAKNEYAKRWRVEHPEQARATRKRWRDENRDYANERAKRYVVKRRISNRKARHANPKKFSEKTRAWRMKYPDRARLADANKKAMRKGVPGRYTVDDINRLIEKQKGKCVYCPAKLANSYHVDHRKPIARGGSNWPRNLQLTCPCCNMRKHTMTHAEFIKRAA